MKKFEYKVISIPIASDPKKNTEILNGEGIRGWKLFSSVYVDINSIHYTFEREYIEGALAKEIEEDSAGGKKPFTRGMEVIRK
jgi:hypothetical protein